MSKQNSLVKVFIALMLLFIGGYVIQILVVEIVKRDALAKSEILMAEAQRSVDVRIAEERKKIDDNKIVSVFVKGRDTKTCLRILNKEYIDNKVIECNKDHYVDMRRGDVDEFKSKQGIE